MTLKDNHTFSQDVLRKLSTQDFLSFGIQDMAYVKSIKVDGQVKYAIHAADGTPLSVMDTYENAMAVIRHNDLEPIDIQ